MLRIYNSIVCPNVGYPAGLPPIEMVMQTAQHEWSEAR